MSIRGLFKARLGRMLDVMAGHVDRSRVPGLLTRISRRGRTEWIVVNVFRTVLHLQGRV